MSMLSSNMFREQTLAIKDGTSSGGFSTHLSLTVNLRTISASLLNPC